MCLIIFQPENKKIPKDYFINAYKNNPHGIGLLTSIAGRITIIKELRSLRKIYKQYLELQKLGLPIIVHFRKKSKGDINIENCHPFKVNKNLAFCHNGTLTKLCTKNSDKDSDTKIFNETILKKLPDDFLFYDGCKKLIKNFLGTSRVAFMSNTKKVYIFNGDLGEWKDGIWVSNDSYSSYKKTKQPSLITEFPHANKTYKQIYRKRRTIWYKQFIRGYHKTVHHYKNTKTRCPYCGLVLVGTAEEKQNYCGLCKLVFEQVTKEKTKLKTLNKPANIIPHPTLFNNNI